MVHSSVALVAIVGVSYIAFQLLSHIVTRYKIASKARELGCQDPPFERFRLPLGIDNVQEAWAADGEQQFMNWFQQRANKMGVYTWSYKLFGKKMISTHEPQNIQAILANQFGTFDLGPLRRGLVRRTWSSFW